MTHISSKSFCVWSRGRWRWTWRRWWRWAGCAHPLHRTSSRYMAVGY